MIAYEWGLVWKDMRKLLGVMYLFINLIVVMVSWDYTYIHPYQVIYLNMLIYFISIIPHLSY